MHLVGGKGINEVDPGRAPEVPVHGLPDHGAQVDGIDQLHVPVLLGDLPEGQTDILHGFTIVFPAVAGDQEHFLLPVGEAVQFLCREAVVLPDGSFQRVDDGVSGDENVLGVPALPEEVFPVPGGGAEVQVRDGRGQYPVHLLGKGGVFVIGPQARFHMAHGHLVVIGGEGTGEGGGGVPVDQDHIGFQRADGLVHAQEALAGDAGEGLPGGHDVQVPAGLYAEDLQHAVQHLPVLGGDAAKTLDALPGGQLFHQGAHFDGLRPGAEDA